MSKLIFALVVTLTTNLMAQTSYYFGEATTIKNKESIKKPYLLSRSLERSSSSIKENVISFGENRFEENSSELLIDNSGRFTMSESTGTVTGSGQLNGEAWNWLSLVGEFKTSGRGYSMRIPDYNLFAGSTILGHKDFYLTIQGQPEFLMMQEDLILHEIDQKTYEEKRQELLNQ